MEKFIPWENAFFIVISRTLIKFSPSANKKNPIK